MYDDAKKKLSLVFLIGLVLLSVGTVEALDITDTTFFASESNSTVFVDFMSLDNVTVTAQRIEFYNVTTVGSNFTNTNATFNATIDFYGLAVGLIVHNVNTIENLFTPTVGNQNFNATFLAGQVLILNDATSQTDLICAGIFGGLTTFATFLAIIALAMVAVAVFFLFSSGVLTVGDMNVQQGVGILITTGVFLTIGAIIVQKMLCL